MTYPSPRQLDRLLEQARYRLLLGQESVTVCGVVYASEAKIDEKLAQLREAERAEPTRAQGAA